MQKQYISWCIILLLIFAYPVAVRAALSNVVVGLQNGVGDVVELYGENLELILDARETALYNLNRVFAISIDAAGMWSALKGALQDGYSYAVDTTQDVLSAIGYLFGDWITQADILANNVYESAAEHCYVSEDGKLYIDGDFVDYVDSFLQWLWSTDGAGLSNYDTGEPTDDLTNNNGINVRYVALTDTYRDGNTNFAFGQYGVYGNYRLYVGVGASGTATSCYFTVYNGTLYFCCPQLATSKTYRLYYDNGHGITYSGYNGTVNLLIKAKFSNNQTMIGDVPVSTADPTDKRIDSSFVPIMTSTADPDIFANMASAEIDLSSYFDITSTDTPTSGDWTITPKQLVQAVAESIAGDQSEQQITAVDGTGAQTVVEATPTGAELQPIEGSPASGSSSFPTITTPSIDGNWNGVEGFQIDLTGVFPFCIPFDIYKLFQKLSVEPVTPVFEIPVAVLERVGIYETITVDLSPFDDFAAHVRNLEKLAILVAVGMLSYKMIFGGD